VSLTSPPLCGAGYWHKLELKMKPVLKCNCSMLFSPVKTMISQNFWFLNTVNPPN